MNRSRTSRVALADLSPARRLLIICARTFMGSASDSAFNSLCDEVLDWDRLVDIADKHNLLPLLYRRISDRFRKAIPQSGLDRLRVAFGAVLLRNQLFTEELIKIMDSLEARGIVVMPYKGPTLAQSLYNDISFRQFDDLDILISKRDVLVAKEILVAQGYRPRYALADVQEAEHLRSGYAYPFMRREGSITIVVEVHWRIFSLELDDLLQHAEQLTLGSKVMSNISYEHLLPILCKHGLNHTWARLGWLCDVAKLINARRSINWEELMKNADVLDGGRSLLIGAVLAGDILGAACPEVVLHRIEADPEVELLAEPMYKQLFNESNDAVSTFVVNVRHTV